jgi:hypothetical protein
VDAAVRCGLHRLMEHILGFTQSHWMLPSGKCLSRIAPVAAMVNEFVETTLKTNTYLQVKAKQFWDTKWTL